MMVHVEQDDCSCQASAGLRCAVRETSGRVKAGAARACLCSLLFSGSRTLENPRGANMRDEL